MRALGRRGLPASIALSGNTYHVEREVKHDFFAATAFYQSSDGQRVVAKFGPRGIVFYKRPVVRPRR